MNNIETLPRIGMLATVRNRRGIITQVESFDGLTGRTHHVNIDYIDSDGAADDQLLWEMEANASLLEPNALPQIVAKNPMQPSQFDALQRAVRWTGLTPFVAEGKPDNQIPTAPIFGAVQVEDFQLVPLLQALQMPRISLLLADDVGLGKTIEAGLILTELLLRRRIRRVLILTPAALRTQWQQEMQDKFSLSFDMIDRAETHAMQKRLGFDANPWRTYPRIISSYYYLRQPDILQQFKTTLQQHAKEARLPWDLLIVDEAHNLMPAPFGDDSDLSKMLREISPYFEHKLFLTATPHNGHTRSFSGLLEQLDPVRFTQKSELDDKEQARIGQVVVRRLKREINQIDSDAGRPKRFSTRIPEPLKLYFGRNENVLSTAFTEFRKAVRRVIAQQSNKEQLAGAFAIEVLNKRLLSCPHTFAHSWFRFMDGLAEEENAPITDLSAAQSAVKEDLDDDLEVESRVQHASQTAGAWLKPLAPHLETEMKRIDTALAWLGLERDQLRPNEDVRFEAVLNLIDKRLRDGRHWRDDERLIIFTEYKTTLDYLLGRLREHYKDDGTVIRHLFGGMADHERTTIKRAFNDSDDAIRILIATDAASEGLNMQETARYLLHYDIPWNPSRLDQRNGRLDRHGQARDVHIFHFTSHQENDLKFLSRVVEKVDQIREDLGSMGELFDAAFERQFRYMGEDVDDILADLDKGVTVRQDRAHIPTTAAQNTGAVHREALAWLRREIDLSADTLQSTLAVALGAGVAHKPLLPTTDNQRVRIDKPDQLIRWKTLIDDALRDENGALPALVFDPSFFIQTTPTGRPVFRHRNDTALIHLGHPLFHRALAMFAQERYPGDRQTQSLWTVRVGEVPADADAVIFLTVEEMAVNELRETFHHWVHTVAIPVRDGELSAPLPHRPAADLYPSSDAIDAHSIALAREIWDDVELDVRDWLVAHREQLTAVCRTRLSETRQAAHAEEKDRFDGRIREVQAAMRTTSLAKLEKELSKLEVEKDALKLQPALLPGAEAQRQFEQEQLAQRQKKVAEELELRQKRYGALVDQLKRERTRVLERLLPARHKMPADAQVFPVTIEVRLPEVAQ